MKKIGLFLLTALAAAAITSCNDSEGDYPSYGDFVTVHPLEGSDYYFTSDNGKTMYPSDKTRVGGYRAEAAELAQRAVIYYNSLPQKAEGYDYNVQLYNIYDIYTNAAKIVTTQEELDALPDSKTSFIDQQFSKSYLTLEVAYPVADESQHTFDLIVDDTDPTAAPTNEGYLDVQLRHNAGGDSGGRDRRYYISFELSAIKERLNTAKGITLRVNTQQNGVKYLKFDLPK